MTRFTHAANKVYPVQVLFRTRQGFCDSNDRHKVDRVSVLRRGNGRWKTSSLADCLRSGENDSPASQLQQWRCLSVCRLETQWKRGTSMLHSDLGRTTGCTRAQGRGEEWEDEWVDIGGEG